MIPMTLPPARLLVAISLLGTGIVARCQVNISANLETYRTNRHMPGLMALRLPPVSKVHSPTPTDRR
jgi:hypothetical protein